MLNIIQAGPQTLLQDSGRQHCQHLGIAQCGAVDQQALHMANLLAGNTNNNTAALEITFGIFSCIFSAPTRIGLAGAPCRAFINNKPLQPYSGINIKKGDILTLKGVTSGMRTYVALKHGITSYSAYNSQSMHPKESWNRHIPNKLNNGDTLTYTPLSSQIRHKPTAYLKPALHPNFTAPLTLYITPCYQYDHFHTTEKTRLLNNSYTVSVDSDRMGTRLTGPAIQWQHTGIPSQPIALGAIQIPPNGQPIILLNDRQTLGGYPIIGCVDQTQLGALSQRTRHQEIIFKYKKSP